MKKKYITNICFFFLCFCSFALCIRILVSKVSHSSSLYNILFFDQNEKIVTGYIDSDFTWEEKYPFYEQNEDNIQIKKEYIFQFRIGMIDKIVSVLENYINDNFPFKNFFLETNAKIDNLAKWNLNIYGKEIRIENNNFGVMHKKQDYTNAALSVSEFNTYLASKSIPYIFVLAPCKIDPKNKLQNILDWSGSNADNFLKILQEQKVEYLDVREIMTEKPFYEYFYDTDHHWKAETGFWIAQTLVDKMSNKEGIGIDTSLFDDSNFDFILYPDSFLGSNGRAVTLGKAKMENFVLIKPRFDTDFHVEFYEKTQTCRIADGTYETLLFYRNLQNENVYNKSSYSVYMDGDNIARITNRKCEQNKKILILGDSFTDVVEPFLCLGVKQLDCVDLRKFTGSLKTWIEKEGPYDYCISINNSGSIPEKINRKSHTDSFDFR